MASLSTLSAAERRAYTHYLCNEYPQESPFTPPSERTAKISGGNNRENIPGSQREVHGTVDLDLRLTSIDGLTYTDVGPGDPLLDYVSPRDRRATQQALATAFATGRTRLLLTDIRGCTWDSNWHDAGNDELEFKAKTLPPWPLGDYRGLRPSPPVKRAGNAIAWAAGVFMFVCGVGMTVATLYWMGVDVTGQLETINAQAGEITTLTTENEVLRTELRYAHRDVTAMEETLAAEEAKVREMRADAGVLFQVQRDDITRVMAAMDSEDTAVLEAVLIMHRLIDEMKAFPDENIYRERFTKLFKATAEHVRSEAPD